MLRIVFGKANGISGLVNGWMDEWLVGSKEEEKEEKKGGGGKVRRYIEEQTRGNRGSVGMYMCATYAFLE